MYYVIQYNIPMINWYVMLTCNTVQQYTAQYKISSYKKNALTTV